MAEPESFDLNNQPRAADAVPAIPTSSSEVSVRTMASDLEAMGQGGGMPSGQAGAPAPQAMHVPVTLHPEADAVAGTGTGAGVTDVTAPRGGLLKVIVITAAVLAAIAGLFALGYFVLGG